MLVVAKKSDFYNNAAISACCCLIRPAEHFHVREISRLTAVPAGSLHRELKLLAEAGLLVRRAVGNQVRYQSNRDCPIFNELAGIFRKTSGMADIIRLALLPLADNVQAAFVFGSVAKGEERAASDVDVCVIGSTSFTDVVMALADMHQKLGREINPVVMPYEQFISKLNAGEQFVTRIMNEPKLFLIGDENDLGNLRNLEKIGQLKSHVTSSEEMKRLLEAARRNLADADVDVISNETRFDSAYKAIMQLALAAMMANGFRSDTSRPGHYIRVIQSLPQTIGLPTGKMAVLDVLRRKRNLTDYSGGWIDETSMEQCIFEAKDLLQLVEDRLKGQRPELL